MSSPGDSDIGDATPVARPGTQGLSALPLPPPLDLGTATAVTSNGAQPPSATSGEILAASSSRSPPSPSLPVALPSPTRSSEPSTPREPQPNYGLGTSLANNGGYFSNMRQRKQSLAGVLAEAQFRSESPLPDDVQPSDYQQRELRYRHMSFAGGLLPESARTASSRSPVTDPLQDRHKTPGSQSLSDSVARFGGRSSLESEASSLNDEGDDESRPLLGGQINESPSAPATAGETPEVENLPRQVSFEGDEDDVDRMIIDAGPQTEEPRFGVDYEWLTQFLSTSVERKKEAFPPSPVARRGADGGEPKRRRTGSSVFRGGVPSSNASLVSSHPPEPAQTTVSFFCPSLPPIVAPTFGDLELGFSKQGKSMIDVMKEPGGDWFWIDVENLDAATMRTLARVFSIHPLTCEDILSATETRTGREKCEFFLGYYFVVTRSFDDDESSPDYLEPVTVHYLVGGGMERDEGGRDPGWIITFHSGPVRHTHNVLRRMELLRPYGLRITADWISYALVDDVVDQFIPILETLEWEVDTIDDLVFILKESEQSDMLKRIGEARKRVTALLRLLTTKSEVIKTLVKRGSGRWIRGGDSEVGVYLGDVQDHVYAAVANLTHYDNTLTRAHSNYLASINLEITISSHRTSDVVMKISTIGAILVPLNIVTGLWGMNVHVPWQHDSPYKSSTAFYVILVCMCVWVFTVLLWARFRGYA